MRIACGNDLHQFRLDHVLGPRRDGDDFICFSAA
jgi:hypothetical protein